MYKCTLIGDDFTYSSENLSKLTSKLHTYLLEMYGKYSISNADGVKMVNAKDILGKGTYIIKTTPRITCIIT